MRSFSRRRLFFLIILAVSTAIRIALSLFPKTASVYYDELLYLELPQNLWQNGSINVYHTPINFTKLLYSLVLSPCFAIRDASLRLSVIAVFNAVILSSALVPGYLLACRILKKDWQILLSVFLLAVCPDMGFSITYMAEILYLPLLMWGFYFLYLVFEDQDNKPLLYLLLGLWSFLLYFTKEVGIAFAGSTLILCIVRLVRNAGLRRKRFFSLCCFLFSFLVPLVLVRFVLLKGVGYSYSAQVSLEYLGSLDDVGFLLYASGLLLLYMLISNLFVPAAFPLLEQHSLSESEKQLGWFVLLYVLFISVGTAFGVYLYDAYRPLLLRIHLRYYIGAFFPLLLLFFQSESAPVFRSSHRSCFVVWGVSVLFLLLVWLFLPVPRVGALVDCPAYYFSFFLPSDQLGSLILKGGLSLIVLLALALWTWRRRWFLPVMAGLLLVFELTNSILFVPAARKEYSPPDPSLITEAEILDHYLSSLDGTVLMIHDDQFSPVMKTLNTYLSEDYLLLLSEDLRSLIHEVPDSRVLSLPENSLPVPLTRFCTADVYPDRQVDYVLLLDPYISLYPESYEEITPEGVTVGKLYRSLDPSVLSIIDPDLYQLGEPISFCGESASFHRYTVSGFSTVESSHTWTEGYEASVSLKPDVEAPVPLTLTWTWLDTIGNQHCRVYAGEELLFDDILPRDTRSLDLSVPLSAWTGNGRIVFRFELPDAAAPNDFDRRILSVAFTSLVLH